MFLLYLITHSPLDESIKYIMSQSAYLRDDSAVGICIYHDEKSCVIRKTVSAPGMFSWQWWQQSADLTPLEEIFRPYSIASMGWFVKEISFRITCEYDFHHPICLSTDWLMTTLYIDWRTGVLVSSLVKLDPEPNIASLSAALLHSVHCLVNETRITEFRCPRLLIAFVNETR